MGNIFVETIVATASLAGAAFERGRKEVEAERMKREAELVELRRRAEDAEAARAEIGDALTSSEARRRELEAMVEPPPHSQLEEWGGLADDILGLVRGGDGPMVVIERPRIQALAEMVPMLIARASALSAALNVDRTGLAAGLVEAINTAQGYLWVTEGRGSYSYDDPRYRAETGRALHAIIASATASLRRSGDLATAALRHMPLPAPGKPVLPEVALSGFLIDEERVRSAIEAGWDQIRDSGGKGPWVARWAGLTQGERASFVRAAQAVLRAVQAASLDTSSQLNLPRVDA